MALTFILAFVGMQLMWHAAKGSALERAVIDQATVGAAVVLINACSQDVHASASGSVILSKGGGLNILNGCDGTEVLFLLVAALMAYPLSWRWRVIGLAGGAAMVFCLNQARLVVLFFAYRSDRALFAQVHGVVAPLALMLAACIFLGVIIVLADQASWRGERIRQCSTAPRPT